MLSSFITDKKLRLREANELAQSSKIEEQLELGFEPRWSDYIYAFVSKEIRKKMKPSLMSAQKCALKTLSNSKSE